MQYKKIRRTRTFFEFQGGAYSQSSRVASFYFSCYPLVFLASQDPLCSGMDRGALGYCIESLILLSPASACHI